MQPRTPSSPRGTRSGPLRRSIPRASMLVRMPRSVAGRVASRRIGPRTTPIPRSSGTCPCRTRRCCRKRARTRRSGARCFADRRMRFRSARAPRRNQEHRREGRPCATRLRRPPRHRSLAAPRCTTRRSRTTRSPARARHASRRRLVARANAAPAASTAHATQSL